MIGADMNQTMDGKKDGDRSMYASKVATNGSSEAGNEPMEVVLDAEDWNVQQKNEVMVNAGELTTMVTLPREPDDDDVGEDSSDAMMSDNESRLVERLEGSQ
ncbi:hypothetical protein V6N12_042158 [Hibiscus sabdariffa]|uniref:Uncharacterized protein n=1 Tax=Hibiscus sabdariffa TaxID=183260 RepID=A0ABR2EHL9_9ROSI